MDQTGKILRRVLSITSTDPPQVPNAQSTVQLPTKTLVELTQPPPATYTIYVDGGWDTVNADFTTAFQEQRDPTNRRGSAGIAIVPTGPDWMDKGTILITLSDGSQIGSQPAHMELATLIIGLALRRWQLPHQQGDIVYSDCKSITDVIKSTVPRLSKHPAKLPFLQAVLQHLTALRPQGTTIDWTKSHPERRSTPDKYTINDWGILLADCAASNHPIPSNIRIQQHLQLSLPTLLQSSIDPATWFVSLPSGMPRMSSPIILKRDLTTFNYLANKRNLQGLSLHMLQKIWKLHQQSYARRTTILKLITGWNVDGSRYALYTQEPQAKLINARCPLCLAPDSDLHWICECPCPALKEPRDTLLNETIPTHLRQLLAHTEQQQEHLLPQLTDLCRALRTGLSNSPHRELLW
jgi:hypothetical protein